MSLYHFHPPCPPWSFCRFLASSYMHAHYPPCALQTSPTRTVCTVPLIDSIHGQTFTIEPQGGGDQDGFARGAWDWSMLWKRVPLGDREKKLRNSRTEPYRYCNTILQHLESSHLETYQLIVLKYVFK